MHCRVQSITVSLLLCVTACTPRIKPIETQAPRAERLPRDTFAAPAQVSSPQPASQPTGAHRKPAVCRITLRNDFIQRIRNRACMSIDFQVLGVGPVHSGATDGDIHAGGVSKDVGLPLVAEIMNAVDEPEAVADLRRARSQHVTVPTMGVWRVWNEHGTWHDHIQGQTETATNPSSNPDHVFEIHPILKLGDRDLARTLRPIPNYDKPRETRLRFADNEALTCRIEPGADTTTLIVQNEHAHNYVEFTIKFDGESVVYSGPDAYMVQGWPEDTNGTRLTPGTRRMVFPKAGSPADVLAAAMPLKGRKLHVLALMRIDLDVVAWRVANRANLDSNLPYELVIVGTFPDQRPENAAVAIPEPDGR